VLELPARVRARRAVEGAGMCQMSFAAQPHLHYGQECQWECACAERVRKGLGSVTLKINTQQHLEPCIVAVSLGGTVCQQVPVPIRPGAGRSAGAAVTWMNRDGDLKENWFLLFSN
jgi:hypothetical protein